MEKRKHSDFGKKYFVQNIYFFIPCAVLFWIAWINFEKQNAIFWVSITMIVLYGIGRIIWDRNRIKLSLPTE
jgi:hypothetical protein